MTETMQAIQVHRYGGPEEFKLERIPRPEPKAGELLVHVYAAGVLPIETAVRAGRLAGVMPAAFPYIPGTAFSGVIEHLRSIVKLIDEMIPIRGLASYWEVNDESSCTDYRRQPGFGKNVGDVSRRARR